MGALFERSNQATAGSPRIGKGSPNERSQGASAILSTFLTESTAQIESCAPRHPCHARPVCLHNVEQKADWRGFSFEEHQSKKVYDLYYCPLPHCLFLGARGGQKKILRGHAHSNSQLCLATPLAVSSYLRHTSPVRKISLSTNFFHRPRPPLVSIYFFDRQHSHYCTNTTTKVQNVVRCLAYPPASPFSDRATSRKRGILHQAIILDVPSSRTPLNKKISMRLHRR